MQHQKDLWAVHGTVTGRLSQAAQFDGPTNWRIEAVAIMAWGNRLNYKSYLLYAEDTKTTALSGAEYQAICVKCNDNLAVIQAHMRRHVDTGDSILLNHWDDNILFQQRNHTE